MTNKKTITKDKTIGIRFFESEKNEIEEISKEIGITPANFCRKAIFEKIERYKNTDSIIEISGENVINSVILDKLGEINDLKKDLKRLTFLVETSLKTDKKKLENLKFSSTIIEKIKTVILNNGRNMTLAKIQEELEDLDGEVIYQHLQFSGYFHNPLNKKGWWVNDE